MNDDRLKMRAEAAAFTEVTSGPEYLSDRDVNLKLCDLNFRRYFDKEKRRLEKAFHMVM